MYKQVNCFQQRPVIPKRQSEKCVGMSKAEVVLQGGAAELS